MASLGCPDEYIIRIEDTTSLVAPYLETTYPSTPTVLHELPWSEINWQRVENDISGASVTVANDLLGNTCCTFPLHGWTESLAVYRDGDLVWWGPILGWRSAGDSVQIVAKDLFYLLSRNVIAADLDTDADLPGRLVAGVISRFISDIETAAATTLGFINLDPRWTGAAIGDVGAGFNILFEHVYLASSYANAWSAIVDLLGDADSFATMLGHTALWPGSTSPWLPTQPTTYLNPVTVVDKPQLVIDCTKVASSYQFTQDNAGTGGFAAVSSDNFLTMEEGFTNQTPHDLRYTPGLYLPEFTQQQPRAGSYSNTPTIDALVPGVTIEALRLSKDYGSPGTNAFGLDFRGRSIPAINGLLPGFTLATWDFEQDCLSAVPVATADPVIGVAVGPATFAYNPVITTCRLVQLDVKVTKTDGGLDEVVSASFVPVGNYGDE